MFRTVLVAFLGIGLAGCMEGSKPTPVARAGKAAKASPQQPAPEPTIGPKVEPKAEPKLEPIPEPKPEPKTTMYDRLGKEAGVVKIVDALVANVVADDKIKERHKKHFMEGDVAGLKKKLVDQIGEATGGPQKYTGKSMKEAHKGLEITNGDFDALLADFAKALDSNRADKKDKNELLKSLESMRKDVVEKAE